jgi:hypothetical protein
MGERGDRTGQLRILKEGIDECPFSDAFHNNYAYLLATSPDASNRNGPEALRVAKRVEEAMSEPNPDYLDTLASAHAEVGDFANAVRVQQRAVQLLEAGGDPDRIEAARSHLAEFEAGRPVRESSD